MNQNLIAPCGMNCGICSGYLREKNKCRGCAKDDGYIMSYCRMCIVRNCEVLKQNKKKYCSDKCEKYPCKRLKDLDKRYRTKYEMSMLENLEFIKENGIRKFVKNEEKRWVKDGKVYCVHNKRWY